MKLCKKRKESTEWLAATTQIRHGISASNQLQASAPPMAATGCSEELVPWTGPSCVGTGAGISLADLTVIKVLAKAGAGRRWLRSVDDSWTGGRISASMRLVVNRRVGDALRLGLQPQGGGEVILPFL